MTKKQKEILGNFVYLSDFGNTVLDESAAKQLEALYPPFGAPKKRRKKAEIANSKEAEWFIKELCRRHFIATASVPSRIAFINGWMVPV